MNIYVFLFKRRFDNLLNLFAEHKDSLSCLAKACDRGVLGLCISFETCG